MKPRMLAIFLVPATLVVCLLGGARLDLEGFTCADVALAAPPRRPKSDAPWVSNSKVNGDLGTADQGSPSIAVDTSGNAYAVWCDERGGDRDIHFSYRPAGASWGPNVRVNDDYGTEDQFSPSIAVDASGNAYAVWVDRRGGGPACYFSHRPAGGSWGVNEMVDSVWCETPSIAVDHDGNAHAVWEAFSNVQSSYRPAGGSWAPEVRVNDVDGTAYMAAPSIAVDATGNAYALWHDVRGDNDDIYFSYRPSGGSWGTDVRVNDDVGTARQQWTTDSSIAVDPSGNAYAAWCDERDGGWAIYSSHRPADGSWGANERVNDNLGTAWSYDPSVGVDSRGNAYVLWWDLRDGNRDIYSSYRPAGGLWGTNAKANDDLGTAYQDSPSIAVDPSGNAYAVWEDFRNGDGDIYFSSRPANDLDGDGLLNEWEQEGIDVNGDGTLDLDLPAMGADPMHKDIFVEVDYMVDQGICLPGMGCRFGHSHQPKPDAIARVVESFSNAPVRNPDGSSGISLHVDYGPEAVMNPLTGELWGSLSKANSLPHEDALGSKNPDGSYNWSDFETIKAENFSRLGASVFHYVVFAHNLGGFGSMSGISRNDASSDAAFRRGASDFIVSLGSWSGQVGTVSQQAGTFMHELGHNLGLRHGGDDHANFEPNFLSIMNYAFQTRGLMVNGQEGYFDYSRFDLDDLDEHSLDETIGLSGSDEVSGYGTRYWCSMDDDRVVGSADAVDWNCDGDTEDTGIQENVNEGPSGAHDTSFDMLESYNDWANLVFSGGSVGWQGAGVTGLSSGPELVELTQEQDEGITSAYSVALAGSGDIAVVPGSTVPYTFTLANRGSSTDTYTLTVKSTQGWADLGSVPSSLILSPGQDIDFALNVEVPAGAAFHEDELSLSAVSQANPLVEDVGIGVISAVGRLYLPLGLRRG